MGRSPGRSWLRRSNADVGGPGRRARGADGHAFALATPSARGDLAGGVARRHDDVIGAARVRGRERREVAPHLGVSPLGMRAGSRGRECDDLGRRRGPE